MYCDYDLTSNSTLSALSREVLLKRKSSLDFTLLKLSESKEYIEKIEKFKTIFHSANKIGLFSDYDCDGLMSAEAFKFTMHKLNRPYEVYIPNRNEKYGLSEVGIQHLHNLGCDVLMTADCGINDVEEIDYAKSLGLTVVVTDHHIQDYELENNADLIFDPTEKEFNSLSGCCVLCLVLSELGIDIHEYVQYIGMTCVSDCMPMIGYSRYFVREMFKNPAALTQQNDKSQTADLVKIACHGSERLSLNELGWKIVPKINAISRMNCIPELNKILTNDVQESSVYLEDLNRQRKSELAKLMLDYEYVDCGTIGVCLVDATVKVGLFGLLASRLVSKHKKPILVGSIDSQRFFKGSGRSDGTLDLHEYLKRCRLGKKFMFGGHQDALGFKTRRSLEWVVERLKRTPSKGCEIERQTEIIDFEVYIDELEEVFKLDKLFFELFPFGAEFQYITFRVHGIQNVEFKKQSSWIWYWSAAYKNIEFRIDDLSLYEIEINKNEYLDLYLFDIENKKKKIFVSKSFV